MKAYENKPSKVKYEKLEQMKLLKLKLSKADRENKQLSNYFHALPITRFSFWFMTLYPLFYPTFTLTTLQDY